MPLNEYCEGGVNLVFSAGLDDLNLDVLQPRRFLYASYPRVYIIEVHKQSDHTSLGSSSETTSNLLSVRSTARMLTPVRLPPGRARLSIKPSDIGSVKF